MHLEIESAIHGESMEKLALGADVAIELRRSAVGPKHLVQHPHSCQLEIGDALILDQRTSAQVFDFAAHGFPNRHIADALYVQVYVVPIQRALRKIRTG